MTFNTTSQVNNLTKPEISQAIFDSNMTSEAPSLVVTAKVPSSVVKSTSTTKKIVRSSDEIEWRAGVADEMRKYGATHGESEKWNKKADAYEECSLNPKTTFKTGINVDLPASVESVLVCPSNKNHDAVVFCASCDNRGCPDCATRQSARLLARYVPVAVDLMRHRRPGERGRHIIFTTPVHIADPDAGDKIDYYAEKIHETLNMVQSSLIRKDSAHHKAVEAELGKKIRTRGYNWKERGGAIVSCEFGETGQMLHFHVYHHGEFIPQHELASCYNYLTGGQASVVWLRGITTDVKEVESSVAETLKYSTKFYKSSVDADGNRVYQFLDPALMPHLMVALDGKRRVRTYGIFYGVTEPEREKCKCAQCQTELVRIKRDLWKEYSTGGMKAVALVDGNHSASGSRSSLKSILANKSENSAVKVADKPPPIRRTGFWLQKSLEKSGSQENKS